MVNKLVCDSCRQAAGWARERDDSHVWSCPHLTSAMKDMRKWGHTPANYGRVIVIGQVPPPGCLHVFEHAVASVNIDKDGIGHA